jgi:hypothetical protein
MEYIIILTVILTIFCIIRLFFGVYIGTRDFGRIGVRKYFLFYYTQEGYKKIFLFERKLDNDS